MTGIISLTLSHNKLTEINVLFGDNFKEKTHKKHLRVPRVGQRIMAGKCEFYYKEIILVQDDEIIKAV